MSEPSEEAKPRLLLIDDSKVMRKSAVKMLGSSFDVVVAIDGRDGWKKICEDDAIQVVFTDLNMPNLNGYELLHTIRTSQDEGIRNIPVIVVTGAENDDEAKELAYDKGATDFITKPFNSTDLRARANAHAEYQRNSKALQNIGKVDPLTQLANAQYFRERLVQDLSLVSRHKEDFTVMLVEFNHFNALFLKIGRSATDSVVKQVAKVLLRSVRKEDTVARLGLARFAVSLPTAKLDGATLLAERICKVVGAFKATLRGESISITISIGLYSPSKRERPELDNVWAGVKEALRMALDAGPGEVHAIASEPIGESGSPSDIGEVQASVAREEVVTEGEPNKGLEQPEEVSNISTLESISIDKALAQLSAGEADVVMLKLPVVLRRLMPLLQLLNDSQKTQLIESLSSN